MDSIQKVVMFGGKGSDNISRDSTFVWDYTGQWKVQVPHAPSQMGAHSSTRMAYDSAVGRVVLFGGYGCPTCPDQNTWLYDGGNLSGSWQLCQSCLGTQPAARASEAFTFNKKSSDPTKQGVVMFGGNEVCCGDDSSVATGPGRDVWTFTGNTLSPNWVKCPATKCPGPPDGPEARSSGELAYYPVGTSLPTVMFGGQTGSTKLGDTWFYDPLATGNRWSPCPVAQCPMGSPPGRFGDRMAYYESGTYKQIVMFGGNEHALGLVNDTWLFTGDPGGWVACGIECPTTPPAVRCCVGLAFDPNINPNTGLPSIVLYGGQHMPQPAAYGDTWTWDPVNGWLCLSAVPCTT